MNFRDFSYNTAKEIAALWICQSDRDIKRNFNIPFFDDNYILKNNINEINEINEIDVKNDVENDVENDEIKNISRLPTFLEIKNIIDELGLLSYFTENLDFMRKMSWKNYTKIFLL